MASNDTGESYNVSVVGAALTPRRDSANAVMERPFVNILDQTWEYSIRMRFMKGYRIGIEYLMLIKEH